MLNYSCHFGLFIARLLMAAVFLFAGISKFLDSESAIALMISKEISNAQLWFYVATFVQIIGALSLILGWKTRFGAFALLGFLFVTNYLMLAFWNEPEGVAKQADMMNFVKNLSVMGGLLYLIFIGPGRIAIDNHCCSPNCQNPAHYHQDQLNP